MALLVAGAFAACAATPYDRYRASHPGWVATLVPPRGASLELVIATLRNPALVTGRIAVLDASGAQWTRLDAAAIEAGRALPAGSVLVASSSACVQTPGDVIRYRAFHWHLLVDGALVAAEQTLFDGRCFEHPERVGAALPREYAECVRRVAREQIQSPAGTTAGCGEADR